MNVHSKSLPLIYFAIDSIFLERSSDAMFNTISGQYSMFSIAFELRLRPITILLERDQLDEIGVMLVELVLSMVLNRMTVLPQ